MSNIIALLYLVSAICFIMALKGLSNPASARLGNWLGMLGMGIAIVATMMIPGVKHYGWMAIMLFSGGLIGLTIAVKINMTAIPQLVAGFHSLVGLAAMLVAFCAFWAPETFGIGHPQDIHALSLIEMGLGLIIGAITFSGSIIAFLKLQGLLSGKPIRFIGQRAVHLLIISIIIGLLVLFIVHQSLFLFASLAGLALLIGLLLILPIGGADMPVVISMLNSYSGWAAAGIGFTLSNHLLVITGALVGASGAILSYVMCTSMNRSFINVIFSSGQTNADDDKQQAERAQVQQANADDAAFLIDNATNIIIVPGYGMAVAHAQHAIKELVVSLEAKNKQVRFAIHPVAGRMPGHMNVLLAEANIPYDQVFEQSEINREFQTTDVVLVVGANDITNPAAKTDQSSPIYGMPILNVEEARHVLFIKRSLSPGYAGVDNALFYKDNTYMLFGDAKDVIESLVQSL